MTALNEPRVDTIELCTVEAIDEMVFNSDLTYGLIILHWRVVQPEPDY